jgi:hypothetical protein
MSHIDLAGLLPSAARCGVDENDIALLVRTEQARTDATLSAPDDLVAAEFGLSRGPSREAAEQQRVCRLGVPLSLGTARLSGDASA